MTPSELAALVAAGIALGGVIFKLGQHSQRLSDAEKDIAELRVKSEDHSTRLGVIARLEQQLSTIEGAVREVAHDVKNMLTGRLVPASRRTTPED